MKAAIFKGKNTPLQVGEVPKPKPVKDQVLVKMKTAAINHRDLWIVQKQEAANRQDGIILGSDGCGTVADVGDDPLLIGRQVIINPSMEWGNNPIVQGDQIFSLEKIQDSFQRMESIDHFGKIVLKINS